MLNDKKLKWNTKFNNDFTEEENFLETILNSYDIEDVQRFLHPKKEDRNDPFLMKNMKKGVKLFHDVIELKEPKIYIKTDSDVDGYTSSCVLQNFIRFLNPEAKLEFGYSYNKEHGLTFNLIANYTKDAFDLIVVPDASMTCADAIQITENFSAPILVLDHHLIEAEYQDTETGKWVSEKEAQEIMSNGGIVKQDKYTDYCIAINDTDGKYPNPTLSGVGVVMKFCEAYCTEYGIEEDILEEWLDLVSTGIIADAMSLKNKETRYYVIEGLKKQNYKNEFLNELEERNSEEFKFGRTPMAVGWYMAPLINGCIRYGKPEEQVDTFRAICGEQEEIEYQPRRKSKNDPIPEKEIHTLQWEMARVCGNVKSRQDTDVRKYMKQIEEKIESENLLNSSVLFVDTNSIVDKKTVSGLVANKLASKYMRPVVLLRDKSSTEYGGSCRGYDKGNISDLNDFLTKAGMSVHGHANAAGVNVKKADLPEVIKKCNEMFPVSDLETIYTVDWEIPAEKLKKEYVEDVANNYMIWGNDIPQPMFAITNLHINATQVIGYGDNKTFIRFVYNGIPFIKKYCPSGEYDRMTLKSNHEIINKKNLTYNIIGQFVLNAWEDKIIPEVKILYYDVEEDTESDYVPPVVKRVKRQTDNLDLLFDDEDEDLEIGKLKGSKEKVEKKATEKKAKKETVKKTISIDDDDFVF